jgi:L-cysteate sulfo-lyase
MEPVFPHRLTLAHLPTPIERLERLSKYLDGPDLLIKRDDQTGLALGGNKARKLEFLCADALTHNCDHIITCGSTQSNHCRQTAAAAAKLGLDCSLVLSGDRPEILGGNTLLDQMLGAHLYWTGRRPAEDVMQEVGKRLSSEGHKPYTIPKGGSNPLGAVGYVWAMKELADQLMKQDLDPDLIVFASSSGGTQAGMVLGKKLYHVPGQILGISNHHTAETLKHQVATLAAETATLLGLNDLNFADEVKVDDSYLGKGYGIVSELEREAVHLLARSEGILLDPVYTGKAMGGLIQQIRQGRWQRGQQLLFWHTGGTPALFAYGDDLL